MATNFPGSVDSFPRPMAAQQRNGLVRMALADYSGTD